MVWIDDNGYQHNERVLAYDADQAWHAFVHLHPNVDTMGLSCIELCERKKKMKRFCVIYVDKFGLEWSDTAVGYSQSAVMIAFQCDHPGCHSVRVYES